MKIIFLGTKGWYSSPTGDTASILIDAKKIPKNYSSHFGPADFPTLDERTRAEKEARKIFPDTTAAVDGLEIKI